MGQIERIAHYEELLDEVTAACAAYEAARARLEAAGPLAAQLARYYTGGEWLRDFAADEAGLLPAQLRRGVLSEDAVYDALEKFDRLRGDISSKE